MTLNISKFSKSQLLAWLSFLIAISTILADVAQFLPAKYSVPLLAITNLIAHVTERLQGGKTKLKAELASGEVTKKEVIQDYEEEFKDNK